MKGMNQSRLVDQADFQVDTLEACIQVHLGIFCGNTDRLINLFKGLRCVSLSSMSGSVMKSVANRFTSSVIWIVADLLSKFLKPCAKVARWMFFAVHSSQLMLPQAYISFSMLICSFAKKIDSSFSCDLTVFFADEWGPLVVDFSSLQ
jgi:hypothetical protein